MIWWGLIRCNYVVVESSTKYDGHKARNRDKNDKIN